MRVNIAKWGNSAAVRLPKAVMDELKLALGGALDLTVEGQAMKLAAAPAPAKLRSLDDMLAEIDRLGLKPPPFEEWSDLNTEWTPYGGAKRGK